MASKKSGVLCGRLLLCGCQTSTKITPTASGSAAIVTSTFSAPAPRTFSTSAPRSTKDHYKLLVVGGGTAGSSAASMFSRKLGAENVAVIDPSQFHYYQPLWTLVGGGLKSLDQTEHSMKSVLPKSCELISESAAEFDPDNNTVTTDRGTKVKYDYLVCTMGLQLNYHLIKGLEEGFKIDPMLCSNYSKEYVLRTRPAMMKFTEGNAIFTFPNTPIKCAGAPQKIMYLTEEYFRETGKRSKAQVIFNSALPVIFGVKKYADALSEIVRERDIQTNFRTNLIEVRADKKEAVFENLDTKETKVFEYSMMHVVPPMSTPDALQQSPLVDETGYITVNKETLQHTKYPNVFALGDNANIPTSKTAAAIASQTKYLKRNLSAVMDGQSLSDKKYDGYTSCPLVTGKNKCIMAEFDWDGQPMETFPIDQSKERRTMYHFKADVFPTIYWNGLVKGLWHGPAFFRKAMRLGMSR